MLIKKLHFDKEVVDVIRDMAWSVEGDTVKGFLIAQLDRTLYTKVNKALEAMGGKWNRSVKCHVFTGDPREKVEGLLQSGVIEKERDGFFRTPHDVIKRMTELVYPTGNVLEPSAGDGAIADQLPILKNRIFCIEKNEHRAQILRDKGYSVFNQDFLTFEIGKAERGFDTIFMNPPFEEEQDIDHVRHAYSMLAVDGKMVSVMAVGFSYRTTKKSIKFRKWLEELEAYIEALPENSFRESGTDVNTCLVVIKKRPLQHGETQQLGLF